MGVKPVMIFVSASKVHLYPLVTVFRPPFRSVFNVKALVGAFNQEKVLVGAFSVIVKPMEHYTALDKSDTGNRIQCPHHPPVSTTLFSFHFRLQYHILYSVWCFHSNPTAILFFLFHQNLSNALKKKDISS